MPRILLCLFCAWTGLVGWHALRIVAAILGEELPLRHRLAFATGVVAGDALAWVLGTLVLGAVFAVWSWRRDKREGPTGDVDL